MNNGWISLHRGILEWEWYDDANTVRLFIHCLLKANHEPKTWRGIDINKGQFYTSLDSLASELGLSSKQIRTSLNKLNKTGEVASSQHARGRMITIVKYESYQDKGRLKGKVEAGLGQAEGRVGAATNNYNNNNNLITKEIVDKPPAKAKRFVEPSLADVQNYFLDKTKDREQSGIEGMKFHAYYESNGWKVGKNKMKSWQSAANGWIARNITQGASNEINKRSTTARPDMSATGRTRTNGAKRRAENDAKIAEIQRNGGLMAANVVNVPSQMD